MASRHRRLVAKDVASAQHFYYPLYLFFSHWSKNLLKTFPNPLKILGRKKPDGDFSLLIQKFEGKRSFEADDFPNPAGRIEINCLCIRIGTLLLNTKTSCTLLSLSLPPSLSPSLFPPLCFFLPSYSLPLSLPIFSYRCSHSLPGFLISLFPLPSWFFNIFVPSHSLAF